jgi:hypothetical protein
MKRFVGLMWLVIAAALAGAYVGSVHIVKEDPLLRLERRTLEIRERDHNLDANAQTDFLVETKRRLVVTERILGIKVITDGLESSTMGMVVPATRVITIAAETSHDGRVSTEIHEVAHLFAPNVFETYGEGEVFAEAVSFLVTRHEHEDIDAYATYLYKHKDYLVVLHAYRAEIEFAARTIWGVE